MGTIYSLFVDGSNLQDTKVAWGFILLKDGVEIHRASGLCSEEYLPYRNVAGEIFSVLEGLKHVASLGIQEIRIYYDYSGLEKWATGEWGYRKALPRMYFEYFQTNTVHIKWNKIKGHSGNFWNEAVDKLARSALSLTEVCDANK